MSHDLDQEAVVACYLRGDRIGDIAESFKISAEVVTWVLRQAGVSYRKQRQLSIDQANAVVVGLRELVRYQDEIIAELRAQLEGAQRAAKVRKRSTG